MDQLKHQKKVNGKVSAAQKKAEELLHSRQREWQSERTFLQRAIELPQQTMEETFPSKKWLRFCLFLSVFIQMTSILLQTLSSK